MLIDEVKALIEPTSPPQADPVLGFPPEIVFRWNTFAKKHGSLVERVMTKVIQKSDGWESASQTRFKCDTDETKKLIDRIAISRRHKTVIFLECKRNLGNVSNPYLRSIRTYDKWCKAKAKEIASELGFTAQDVLVRFAILNAYGEDSDRDKVKGIPVLLPENLPLIFPMSVFDAFEELHRTVQTVVGEHPAFRNQTFLEDISDIGILMQNDALRLPTAESSVGFRERIHDALERCTSF